MTSIITLGRDVIRYLSDFLSLRNKIEFKKTCKTINSLVKITDLCHIPDCYIEKMRLEHLMNNPNIKYLKAGPNLARLTGFPNLNVIYNKNAELTETETEKLYLEELWLPYESKKKYTNYFPNLKVLYANSELIDEDIKELDLEELYLPYNTRITDISHLTKLKHLTCLCRTASYFDQLMKLNLKSLHVRINTYNLWHINHMSNLRVLDCSKTNLPCQQLQGLNLRKLKCLLSTGIFKIPYMSNLKVLHCDARVEIHPDNLPNLKSLNILVDRSLKFEALQYCINLTKLEYTSFERTNDVHLFKNLNLHTLILRFQKDHLELGHMTNLRRLILYDCNELDNKLVENLNLEYLRIGVTNISQLGHMTRLRYLDCSTPCNNFRNRNRIDFENLNLEALVAAGNMSIDKISHMTNLRFLDCSKGCSITENDLEGLNLRFIKSKGNKNVKLRDISKEDEYEWQNILDIKLKYSYLSDFDLLLHENYF